MRDLNAATCTRKPLNKYHDNLQKRVPLYLTELIARLPP